ncbi:HET-domain-containing protein [Trematosphaeria pertusa]|uniref:HET-domain-containing protein n=1 Tax=Trematosphaeria pertusa TaxID=390896 RepID=A0A6A6ITS6_9PLEO|nr:HET-domain-containing protein [Trematosphaeria pertusa]KAF2253759.1 HET-domain-containing protein [Trematosphaeria pertusa]
MSSSSTLEPYQHRPLTDTRSTRVLLLEPAHTNDAPLRCSLVEINLDTFDERTQSYAALSYVWGYRHGDREIVCEGKSLLVTRNCEDAMRALRLRVEPRHLWIDAICIDQKDDAYAVNERSGQISLMGEIYRTAAHVLVWFGQGTQEIFEALEHLKKIDKYKKRKRESDVLPLSLQPPWRSLPKLLAAGAIDYLRRPFGAWMSSRHTAQFKRLYDNGHLQAIFQNEWALRVWTIQEVAFARVCSIIFGRKDGGFYLISFDDFYVLTGGGGAVADPEIVGYTLSLLFKKYLRIEIQAHLREPHASSTDVDAMLRVMQLLSYMKTTESRDMVYGIYPILKAFGVELSPPDYTKPVETVYEDMTRSLIKSTQCLQPLRYAAAMDRQSLLPSWVPNWAGNRQSFLVLASIETGGFQATGGGSPVAEFPAMGQISLHGRQICQVHRRASRDCAGPKDTGSAKNPEFWHADFILAWREWLFVSGILNATSKNYSDYGALLNALSLGTCASAKRLEAFKVFISVLQYPRNCEYDLGAAASVVSKFREQAIGAEYHWTDDFYNGLVIDQALRTPRNSGIVRKALPHAMEIQQLVQDMQVWTFDRAFFLTEHGDMGMCFPTIREGDILVQFYGAGEPFALRPIEGYYILIGPTYVHALKDLDRPSEDDLRSMEKYTLI